jgi:hypothetical protein
VTANEREGIMSLRQSITTPGAQSEMNVKELTDDGAFDLFDQTAPDLLNISGDEFLRRWDAGEYAEGRQEPRIETMVIVLPLIRDFK